ncbi:NAD-binding protein [Acidisoma cellulosilytica]|uniref:NAD-binding protein n=1 Tax=Acidisoma cellulosilyticum TaxID=2802395 RepID=A0A963Z0G1_9PROT|nr:potassium channel protein [Acidisoma cellulosilyticum]MCB8880254.1 NAD-binding protein [Acidisoma cellulosilyticum]
MARRNPKLARGKRPLPFRIWLGRLLGSPIRNLVLGGLFVFIICVAATCGYLAAGWSLSDALYMVVITIYTVGYDEVRTISTPFLRANTMMLIVLGCTGMIFLTGALVQFITITQFQQLFGTRRMKHDIDQLDGHVIVCGFGRIGYTLAQELSAGQMPFIILERSERRFAEIRDLGYLCLQADATDEHTLQQAGIERARVLATVLPDDAANVFITLSARSLNPGLEIIARGEVASTERKLIQAGANRVVMPANIGAERMAQMILFPESEQFLQGSERMRAFQNQLLRLGLNVLTHPVAAESRCVGLSLAQTESAGAGSFFIVGLERPDEQSISRPPPDTVLQAGDGVVLVSRDGHAQVIASIFSSPHGTI